MPGFGLAILPSIDRTDAPAGLNRDGSDPAHRVADVADRGAC